MAQAAYLSMPLNSTGTLGMSSGQASSAVQPVSNLSSTSSNFPSTSSSNGGPSTLATAFKAPQHRHAHHLHSIPPREKSTRTLIIDHMLWVHGRTRFSQARAELGMTDRTGGPSSSNYVHRQRPENFEEEEEELSDAEGVVVLKAKGGPGYPQNDDDEERLAQQDLILARSLRLRAEGLEKVVISMLDQPPPVHPVLDDDILDPQTSPKQGPQSAPGDSTHPHTLPNGVRLRLALGTVINDLFARQAPPPPYRHHHDLNTGTSKGSRGMTVADPTALPRALIPLSTISASSTRRTGSFSSPALLTHGVAQNYSQRWDSNPPTPSDRIRALYMAGADPSTANSPPAFRCPRHLHTGCEICVEAKSSGKPTSGVGRMRAGSSDNLSSPGVIGNSPGRNGQSGIRKGTGGVGGLTGWRDGSGIGSGLTRPGFDGNVLRRKSSSVTSHNITNGGLGAGNTKLSELIPRFMRLSALVAMELGGEARDEEDGVSSPGRERDRESGMGAGWDSDDNRQYLQEFSDENRPAIVTSSPPTARTPLSTNGGLSKMTLYVLRPSREWYMLLAGLLTRAVLEGYLTAGWRGLEAVECLLAVGLDIPDNHSNRIPNSPGSDREVQDDSGDQDNGDHEFDEEFEPLDPDGLPTLKEAAQMLFPSLQGTERRSWKDDAEGEFMVEMTERLKRFYDIPESTPDVSTHMEDLAWQYPAEPVERAAVRFCEAIAKWRGKPELETYKKKPPQSSQSQDIPSTPGGSAMTIESLVHSNPTSPTTSSRPPRIERPRRPLIERYFTPPITQDRQNVWGGIKRRRVSDEARDDPSKRTHP